MFLKCPNGSCEPILDIFLPRSSQWYEVFLNLMGFDPYNRSLKIRESIETPTPKVGAPLRVWGFIPSHFPSLPASLLARNLTRHCLGREPKARVVTMFMFFVWHECITVCFCSLFDFNALFCISIPCSNFKAFMFKLSLKLQPLKKFKLINTCLVTKPSKGMCF